MLRYRTSCYRKSCCFRLGLGSIFGPCVTLPSVFHNRNAAALSDKHSHSRFFPHWTMLEDQEGTPSKRLKVEQRVVVKAETAEKAELDAAPGASTCTVAQVLEWCQAKWKDITEKVHPLQYLRQELKSKEAKIQFCRAAVKAMEQAHPGLRQTCLSRICMEDAVQQGIGCSGEAHILMPGFDKMQGIGMPVFWKGDPSLDRLWDVIERSLLSGRGVDTTSKAFKLAVAKDWCNKDLSKQMFFAGYVSGSTLGGGSMLLLYFLVTYPALGGDVWLLPEVQAFLLSSSRLKCTFVVYDNLQARTLDSWSAPLIVA